MNLDSFEKVKELVSMPEIAAAYGLEVKRNGFARCPWHTDKTASMKLYDGRRGFYCFSCHRGGDVISFVSTYFNISPLEAARKINSDFGLGLDLSPHRQTEAERIAALKRERLIEVNERYEAWRKETLTILDTTLQAINQIPRDRPPDELTAGQREGIMWEEPIEFWADKLLFGDMDEQMAIFDDRRAVIQRCRGIIEKLQDSRTK